MQFVLNRSIALISILFFLALNAKSQVFTLPVANKVPCGWVGPRKDVVIPVSNLWSPLTTCYVLREVRVQLGSPTCRRSLNTYRMELIAPNGTKINLSGSTISNPAESMLTIISSVWMKVKFRDHPVLKRLRDYSNSVQGAYFPYSIGYYRSQDPFSIFNGINPNGNWMLSVIKNGTTNGISIENVELIFGSPINVSDLTGNKNNDFCSGAACISNGVFIGTNVGYSNSDPLFPGSLVNGCDWNGASNNSAWFRFVPNAPNVKITLSALTSNCKRSNDIQPIILKGNGCAAPPSIVPTGGCLKDENINNREYLQTLGGGVNPGNIYIGGISANAEFNLSGLTVGSDYYLYVDGNSYTLGTPCSAESTFYIEVEDKGSNSFNFYRCSPPLSLSGPSTVCSGPLSVPYTSNDNSSCPGTWSVQPSFAGNFLAPSQNQTAFFFPSQQITNPIFATITYTASGTEGFSANLPITIYPITTPVFTQQPAVCKGTLFKLPTTSNNGITGIWSPTENSQVTTTYTFKPTFTPNSPQCPGTSTMTVTVKSALDEICGNNIDDDCDGFVDNVYKFVGNGNFSNPSNWECESLPANPLPANYKILIMPQSNGSCTLDIQYKALKGAQFIVSEGKQLLIPGNLIIE